MGKQFLTIIDPATIVKGGSGSGNFGHAGRPGEVGGSAPAGTTPAGDGDKKQDDVPRVWTGDQHEKNPGLTKLDTGALGEKTVSRVIGEFLGVDLETVNQGINNAPFDLAGGHMAIEVKAGLASNASDAQKWRATIGQPGKAETESLRSMTAEEKRRHNDAKRKAILQRKHDLLARMGQEANKKIDPYTAGVIVSGDGKRADVYLVPDFHLTLRWNKYATDDYWVGTVDLESGKVAWNKQVLPDFFRLAAAQKAIIPEPSEQRQAALDVAMAEVDADFAVVLERWRKQILAKATYD